MLQPELLKKVISLFHENEIDYMVSGSIVSSIQGEPRATHDIDIVINITKSAINKLIETFNPPQYYLSEDAISDAIKYSSMFNLLDTSFGDKIDFWVLSNSSFDQSRFSRRYLEDVPDLKMVISKPEDTILMKLNWAVLSGGSEKQFIDALRVYELQYSALDLDYIHKWVAELKIQNIWLKLVQDAQPLR